MYAEKEGIEAVCRDMELGLSTYSIAQHVKCDLACPWVRGALKKKPQHTVRKPQIFVASLYRVGSALKLKKA